MKICFILPFTLFYFLECVKAQAPENVSRHGVSYRMGPRVYNLDEIAGSPYINSEFKPGLIFFLNGDSLSRQMRYNIYTGQMEYNDGKDVREIITIDKIEKIVLDEMVFHYKAHFSSASKTKTGLFIEVELGEISLFKLPQVIFEEVNQAYSNYSAEFKRKRDAFYMEIDGEFMQLGKSRADIKDAFNAKYRREVDVFMKKNKSKPSNEDDMARLVIYINQLMAEENR